MGGVVNVAIRFKDGRTICKEVWTNPTSHWFRQPKMYEGDETYIQKYLDGDKTAPNSPLRNSDYGLIVWDYLSGNLLDNNGYCFFHTMDLVHVATYQQFNKDDASIRDLANDGRLILENYETNVRAEKPSTYEEIIKLGRTWSNPEMLRSHFVIDTRPLNVSIFASPQHQ